MKHILLIITLVVVFFIPSKAQTDSTIVKNFTMPVNDWLIITPILNNSSDSTYFTPFIKLRNMARAAGANISLSANVTMDTIPVSTLVSIYGSIATQQSGYAVLPAFQTALAPYRSANSNLNRQCAVIEANYLTVMQSMYAALFKILRGY